MRASNLCGACNSTVPENVLKKRRRNDAIKKRTDSFKTKEVQSWTHLRSYTPNSTALTRHDTTHQQAGRKKERRERAFRNAESYVKEYRQRERMLIRCRRQARAAGNYFVEPQANLILVVRIRGIMGVSPKVRKVLQLLRLRQIHNATFVKVNKATLQMLQWVIPYVAFG